MNSAAVKNPDLVTKPQEIWKRQNNNSIDADGTNKCHPDLSWSFRGHQAVGKDAVDWPSNAGIRCGGDPSTYGWGWNQTGYIWNLQRRFRAVDLPVVASGGAGNLSIFMKGGERWRQILLAASVSTIDLKH